MLDTGTSVVRNTAADQLAQVQKAHPHELFNLLGRVVPYLKSQQWETRVAAARAIGGILDNTIRFEPNQGPEIDQEVVKAETGQADLSIKVDHDDKLHFATFDITNVVKNGKALLGSAGKEYDFNMASLPAEERLARAKHNVTSRLGLGAEYMEDDFLSAQDLATPTLISPKAQASPVETAEADSALSARQRNMMKRKAKVNGKGGSNKVRVIDVSSSSAARKASEDPSALATPIKREASDYFSVTDQAQNASKIVVEHKLAPASPSDLLDSTDSKCWPLEGLMELLIVDLFDPRWETRHGAASALREVFRTHARAAGREVGLSKSANDQLNRTYLDDLACRLCCIFALDRFGDYVSDQVIAPIREVVSQTLATLLLHLSDMSVQATFSLLSKLVFQKTLPVKAWEVTHGGMLGMKYLVAIRKDVLMHETDMLDGVVSAVLYGLADHDDDVRAVSAATLIPIVNEFVELRPALLGPLLDVLWDCLAELRDDLSASTGSVMDLLAKLCSIPEVLTVMQEKAKLDSDNSFASLVPRLYPFLRHTITSVRRAVLRALHTFFTADSSAAQEWTDAKFFRLLFQNLLVEQNDAVLTSSQTLWSDIVDACPADRLVDTTSQLTDIMLRLTMTPLGIDRSAVPLDLALFIRPSGQTYLLTQSTTQSKAKDRKRKELHEEPGVGSSIDSPMLRGEIELVGHEVLMRTRVAAATALGHLLARWPVPDGSARVLAVSQYTESRFSTTRLLSFVAIQAYITTAGSTAELTHRLESNLSAASPQHYDNLTPLLHVLRSQCQAFNNTLMERGRVPASKISALPALCQGDPEAGPSAFTIQMAENMVGEEYDKHQRNMAAKGPAMKSIEDARSTVQSAVDRYKEQMGVENVRIAAACGSAFVAIGTLPKKLNPIIKVLMDSIKKEENLLLQSRSADAITTLVKLCSNFNRSAAADKLLKNLCAFLCVDTGATPEFRKHIAVKEGIYSLRKNELGEVTSQAQKEIDIKRKGAQLALESMARCFQESFFSIAPKVRECMLRPLETAFGTSTPDFASKDTELGQDLIDALTIISAMSGTLHSSLLATVWTHLPQCLFALQSEYSSVRYAAAHCFAELCAADPTKGLMIAVQDVLPLLADAGNTYRRQGAIEAVNMLVVRLDAQILPYVIFLIVPILGRMSDSNNDIRIVATTTFALLVKLVPLEEGIPDPPGFSEAMLEGRDNERKFIQQMLDGSKVEPFVIPVAIKADLRSYQQDGVNWLAFLNRYQLHGILCDDMGLGKTLQTICIVASDHHNRAAKHKLTASNETRPLPSLIVCPPSLTGHWQHEIQTYAPFLSCIAYVGQPAERRDLCSRFMKTDIIVTSYDIARNDIEILSDQSFNYCVLDEGHIIKNTKAKLTQAVKLIQANHRLILSGTPIQNNVLELWSLFDFLMPGFLGTEKSFYDRYAKPIANSRDSKTSSKEQEAGALALEALHKQVLPFLLRRLKEEVLADLPPKIIQDYYCELSPLQKSLYTEFATSQASQMATETSGEMKKEAKTHVFQVLQYMRKLCNHPALVLNEKHPKYKETIASLAKNSQTLRDVQHAPKFLALRDLLLDCGIGRAEPAANDLTADVVNQHRALIFCQLKDMLDMVESDVLKKLLPSVSYMRLDGTTDPRNRQSIVQKFNADPSIDVLLLTTHVGGLGLNLTGADTVIFVEHDWNPMKDLQAMDRAHRIGQKNTVNVYRLITRGTLEEKIMGLQKFKMNIASTVVNQQNSGLATMETDQILDLFNVGSEAEEKKSTDQTGLDSQGNVIKKGQKSVFDDLEELHNETEYDEFNLDSFVQTL